MLKFFNLNLNFLKSILYFWFWSLGFCPGFKPSREFLEYATKEVEQIMKKTHASYEDAVDDAVISILLLKKREFKKDHRVWLHKSTTKRKSERPCLSRDA